MLNLEDEMSNRQFVLLLVCTMVCALIGGAVASGVFFNNTLSAQNQLSFTHKDFKLPEGTIIGTVEKGKFYPLFPKQPMPMPIRLTTISMQEARPVESGELDLIPYEGKAVMVSGHDGGSWIYRAQIADSGGPLITALVKKIFTN